MKAQHFAIPLLFLLLSSAPLRAEKIGIFYDHSIPQFEFAASDIKKALESQDIEIELLPASKLSAKYKNRKIVIALRSDASSIKILKKECGKIDKIAGLGEQA